VGQQQRIAADPGFRLRLDLQTQLGLQPRCSQEARRIITKSPLTRRPDLHIPQILLTTKRINQLTGFIHRHGVDSEVSFCQISVQAAAAKASEIKVHTRPVLRPEHNSRRPPLLIQREEGATQCIADSPSERHRILINREVPIVHRPPQQQIPDGPTHDPDADASRLG
jgi:hypothetical protein